MNCPICDGENREGVVTCKKCGEDLTLPPPWAPTWRWHGKVLLGISISLIIIYIGVSTLLSRLPEPYRMRDVPPEVTPWLR